MNFNKEALAQSLLDLILSCPKLRKLEIEGFMRGLDRNKKTNGVPAHVIYSSLLKQVADFDRAFKDSSLDEQLRALADVRNVAGLLLLKLLGEI